MCFNVDVVCHNAIVYFVECIDRGVFPINLYNKEMLYYCHRSLVYFN